MRATDFTLPKKSKRNPHETRTESSICPKWFIAFRCAGLTLWRPAKASLPCLTAAAEPAGLTAPRQAQGPQSPLWYEQHTTGPYAHVDTKLGIINSQADLPAMPRVIKVNGTRISSASICTGGSALSRSLRGEANWMHREMVPAQYFSVSWY